MTSQSPEVQALARCSMCPGTASKRFARDIATMPPDKELSSRQAAFLWRLLYVFRRQLPREIAEEAVRRKVDHKWEIAGEKHMDDRDYRCSVCGYHLTSKRERNAPCPGPPEPKPPKKPRKAKAAAAPAAGPAAPQDSLFEESR